MKFNKKDRLKAFRNLMDRKESSIKSTIVKSPTSEEYKKRCDEREKRLILRYDENISDISIETVQVAQAQVEEKVSTLVAEKEAEINAQ